MHTLLNDYEIDLCNLLAVLGILSKLCNNNEYRNEYNNIYSIIKDIMQVVKRSKLANMLKWNEIQGQLLIFHTRYCIKSQEILVGISKRIRTHLFANNNITSYIRFREDEDNDGDNNKDE